MTFKGFPSRIAAALAVVAGVLVGCGGGDTVDPFEPRRMFAMGDELSVIEDDGRKYTVNALSSTDPLAIDCTNFRLWTQIVARGVGLVFPECNPDNVAAPQGEILATVGATVAGLQQQVDTLLQARAPNGDDLVTMLVGMHDVLALYADRAARDEAALLDEARRRGELLAAQVNRVVAVGPAVIVSTVPDVSLTPFGVREAAADPANARLLRRLGQAMNEGLRLNMVQDGRLAGIVFIDAVVDVAVDRDFSGISNDPRAVREGVCTVALPDCHNRVEDLVQGGSAVGWVWADDLRPGPLVQFELGQQALSRARNNPF